MKIKTLLGLALSLLLVTSAFADESQFKSASKVVLLDSTYVNVKPTGSGTFSIVRQIKAQTDAGALSMHCVVYDYDPLTAFACFKYAKIKHKDGSVTDIDVSKAKDYAAPAGTILWGARQILLEAGQMSAGDILCYEIEKKGFTYALLNDAEVLSSFGGGASVGSASSMMSASNSLTNNVDDEDRFVPPLKGQFYDIVPFWANDPTRRKVYRISLPDTCNLQYKVYQCEEPYKEEKTVENGRQYLTITMTNIVPFKKEQNMADLYDVAPKLMLSTTKNWKVKSLWFNKVNEDYGSFDATPDTKAKVAEIIKGKKTEMEKISALTHWVADNIRYVGLSMGKGEGYTLHKLDMDFTDRGGVCKDIAGTLIGFLRIAGFEAYPAMTMAGSRVEQIPADHFNHCVCVVRLKDGTLMPLDPTWAPFKRELWSSAEQQQNYLPGIPEGSDLKETPISAPENHYLRMIADNTLTADGTLKGTLTVSAEGQSDGSVRRIFTLGWISTWQQSLESEILRVSPQAKVLSVDYGKNPKDYQAAPIKIVFTYEIPNYAIGSGEGMIFKPMLLNNLYSGVQSFLRVGGNVDEHKYAFKDGCSRQVLLDETITLPAGLKMQSQPLASDITNEAASIKASLLQNGNKIKLNVNAAFNKRVYQANEWPGFKSVVDNYKKYQNYIYIR